MTTATQAVPMLKDQIADSGAALARAFLDDPLMMYILQDDTRRPGALRWFMTAAAGYGHAHGEVFTTAGNVEGNAIWLPPGDVKVTTIRMIRHGVIAAPFRFGIGAFGRFLSVMNHFEHLHDRDMPQPHWYLMVLGVDPPRQGQGVGGALIQPMLARADSAGLPCYLETQKERNVPFYQKHGFEVIVDEVLPKGGPRCWTMKRMPHA
jgi:GNAT superfamily N-acetyltransferase